VRYEQILPRRLPNSRKRLSTSGLRPISPPIRLLEIVSLNLMLDGVSLSYTTRKPFDFFVKGFPSRYIGL